MNRRLLLHNELCSVLGCPISGTDCRAYFQPPATIHMKYPAIVYTLDNMSSKYANDGHYLDKRRYSVIVIDQNPDSELPEKMLALPLIQFDRAYTQDNLNHFVFEIFY